MAGGPSAEGEKDGDDSTTKASKQNNGTGRNGQVASSIPFSLGFFFFLCTLAHVWDGPPPRSTVIFIFYGAMMLIPPSTV